MYENEAAAGAGTSRALPLYVEARAPPSTLLLTFTTAEATSKEAEYKHRGLNFMSASTLHAIVRRGGFGDLCHLMAPSSFRPLRPLARDARAWYDL